MLIFKFRYWQSIRQLREFYHHESIEMMFAKAKKRFHASLAVHRNETLKFLSSLVVEPAVES